MLSQLQLIQFFQLRLSHNSTKMLATMPIGIMGSNNLALFGWGSQCLARRKEMHEYTSVLLPSLAPKHLAVQSIKSKTIVTHNNFWHCHIHFYTFVTKPFSKQLAVYSWWHSIPLKPEIHKYMYSKCQTEGRLD